MGKLALERGYVTPEQLQQALAQQALDVQRGRPIPRNLGNILMQMKFITDQQLADLLELQRARRGTQEGLPASPTAPEPPPSPKTHRFGRYLILREIGRGGMGIVFEALDTELNRKVALKTLLSSGEGSPSAGREEERFLREARLSARLSKHPHIVGVYDAGRIGDRSYIAMEYIEGRNMSEWRKTVRPPVRLQVQLLRDVAQAVHYAHKAGIIHRDLKPANVLVDARNEPHVTDFGLAKNLTADAGASLTVSGSIMGTPAYMSPEQAQGKKEVDRRTDVYSLGVMLYEILTGRTPFRGNSPVDIITKILRDPIPPPSSLQRVAGSPPPDPVLEKICLKALQKRPTDRYGSAQALADDLTRWLEGREVSIEPPRPDRTRLYIVCSAAAAVIILLSLYLLLGPSGKSQAELIRQARTCRDASNYEEAWTLYKRALKEDPSNTKALEGLRQLEQIWFDVIEGKIRGGRTSDPEDEYANFLERFPNHSRAKEAFAKLRDRRLDAVVAQAERLLGEGKVWEATSRLNEVFKENPSHPAGLALKEKMNGPAAAEKPSREVPPPGPVPPTPPKPSPPAPAPALPTPRPADPPVASIVFGPEIQAAGLEMRTDPTTVYETTTFEGKTCLKTTGAQRLYFDIDDDWAAQAKAVEVEVEYFDLGGSYWELKYDSRDDSLPMGGAYRDGGHCKVASTRTWKTETFRWEDPRFQNRQERYCDFRIFLGPKETYLHRITLRRVEPSSPPPDRPAESPRDPEGWVPLLADPRLPGWKIVSQRVRIDDDALVLEDGGEIQRPVASADFDLRGSVRLDNGTYPFAAGNIAFRRPGSSRHGDSVRFHMDGDIHFGRLKTGPRKILPGQWTTFLLEIRGGEGALSINGKAVLRFRPSSLNPGFLALYSNDRGTAIAFKDLWLRELGTGPAGTGTWPPAGSRILLSFDFEDGRTGPWEEGCTISRTDLLPGSRAALQAKPLVNDKYFAAVARTGMDIKGGDGIVMRKPVLTIGPSTWLSLAFHPGKCSRFKVQCGIGKTTGAKYNFGIEFFAPWKSPGWIRLRTPLARLKNQTPNIPLEDQYPSSGDVLHKIDLLAGKPDEAGTLRIDDVIFFEPPEGWQGPAEPILEPASP